MPLLSLTLVLGSGFWDSGFLQVSGLQGLKLWNIELAANRPFKLDTWNIVEARFEIEEWTKVNLVLESPFL